MLCDCLNMYVVCCMLPVACCTLSLACRLLNVVCCVFTRHDVCAVLCDVHGVLNAVGCVLYVVG